MTVGIFDSGVGGLAALEELRRLRPDLDYLYLADTAWAPYGPLPPERIRERVAQVGGFLRGAGAEALVVACNTASAWGAGALEGLRVPVLETVGPTRQAAGSEEGTVVWTTAATWKSGVYREVGEVRPTPLLAPMVEEGHLEGPVAEAVVGAYLERLPAGTRRLVLGCTHYSFLRPVISRLAPHLALVDSAVALARTAARRLPSARGRGRVRLLVTGERGAYSRRVGVEAEEVRL